MVRHFGSSGRYDEVTEIAEDRFPPNQTKMEESIISKMLLRPRDAQLDCLNALMTGISVLAALPTASGKSEIVFMYLEALCLVSFILFCFCDLKNISRRFPAGVI